MPVYSYRCDHCGVQFDRHREFSEDPLEVCPECGEHALRKLFQPVGIVFKGSGFYSTDNRSGSKKKSEKPEKKDNSKEAKADTESKSADAAEK